MKQGYLKVGDTQPSIKGVLGAGKDPVNLEGATVQLFVKDRDTGEIIVDGRNANITDGENGEVEVDWDPDDSDKERDLLAEWVASFDDGEITFPNRGFIPVKISEDIKSKTTEA